MHHRADHALRARLATAVATAAAVAAAATAILAPASATARPAAQGPVREQRDPDLAFLVPRQEFLLVWSEDRGAGHRIFAKRVRANGLPMGGASGGEWEATRAVADPSGAPARKGDQRWPALIDGMLVYSELVPGGTDYDLYAQRLFDNGHPSSPPKLVAGGPGNQSHADLVAVDRGRLGREYLIVWSQDTTDKGDVMGIRVDYALFRSRGPAFPIAQGPGTAEDPVIARDPGDNKGFLVLFVDDRDGNRDIWGTRLVESGLPRGGPTGGHFPVVQTAQEDYAPQLVNSLQPTGLGPTPTPGRGRPPNTRKETKHLMVWTTDSLLDGPEVMAQRLHVNGLPVGSSFALAAGPGAQGSPAAALRAVDRSRPGNSREQDEWLTAWTDDRRGGLDVLGVPVGVNGLVRRTPLTLSGD